MHVNVGYDGVASRVSWLFPCSGAQNDLERITKMAYSQVAIYGMNAKVGLVSYPNEEGSFNKPYSNETAQMIDNEVRKMVQTAYERTITLLEEKKTLVTALAETLLQKDVSESSNKPKFCCFFWSGTCACTAYPCCIFGSGTCPAAFYC